jgi:hypothetical protein
MRYNQVFILSAKKSFKAFLSRSNILWTYLNLLLQYAVHETSFSNPFLKLSKFLNPYPKSWPGFWSEFWPWILVLNPKNECYPYFNPESCPFNWAQIWPLIMTQYWPLMQTLILSLKVALKSFTLYYINPSKRCSPVPQCLRSAQAVFVYLRMNVKNSQFQLAMTQYYF